MFLEINKQLNNFIHNLKLDERLVAILKTGFSSLIIKLLSVIISFISVPLTYNYLGVDRYGIWLTITSMVAFLTFADLGLGISLINPYNEIE